MAHNSYTTAEVAGLNSLMSTQGPSNDVAGLVAERVGHSGGTANTATSEGGMKGSAQPSPLRAPSSAQLTTGSPLDLSRPIKTEAEASTSLSTVAHPPPVTSAAHPAPLLPSPQTQGPSLPSPGAAVVRPSGPDTPSGATSSLPLAMSSAAASIGAFGSPLTSLGAELKLSQEEQATAYKKANILALSALAKKGGPNAKEMLAVQAKLQEFLTNLISLAGNSGPQLKATVQLLVQQLVTGAITEDEFATKIEKDLHSQHQPSLLPFLQNSVPHLRTRLQLQQAIMKELLQRQAHEKVQKKLLLEQKLAKDRGVIPSTTISSANLQLGANNTAPLRVAQNTQQGVGAGVMLGGLAGAVKVGLIQQQQQQQMQRVQSLPDQVKLNHGLNLAQLQSIASGSSSLSSSSSSPSSLSQASFTPLTAGSALLTTTSSSPANNHSSLSSSSSLTPTLPVSPVTVSAQLQQLSRLSPQQRLLMVQQIKKHTQQQQHNLAQVALAAHTQAVTNQPVLTAQQKLAVARQNALAQQSHSATTSTASSSVSNGNGAPPPAVVLQQQQKLVKEQQQASLGLVGSAIGSGSLKSAAGISGMSASASSVGGASVGMLGVSTGQTGRNQGGGGVSPSKGAQGKLHVNSNHSTSPVVGGRGKGRAKTESGKPAADEEEEEDDEIDFSGVKAVNLQAESVLPTTLGETLRTVQDEAFFDLTLLKQKVLGLENVMYKVFVEAHQSITIAQRYNVSHVADDYLVLLSHALQERVRDILEKVTVISQHRTEALKDDEQYEVSSEVRGQLKVLESIDKLNHKRKQEREKEQILKAARSRSKAEDPETAAKIKEQAKRLQQEEEQKIRDRAANEAALAAIGSRLKRKRLSATAASDGASGGLLSSLNPDSSGGHTSLLGAQTTSRQPKRRVTARDLIFYMEQSKETRKSLVLYKSLLK